MPDLSAVLERSTSATPFTYVQEQDGFLALFPHRYDYIWAEYPGPHDKLEWKTESRHPLSDRLIQQGAYLYGVRFGAETRYCLLDIDAGSCYHPSRDPFAIARILAALEPLGLVAYVACTSSYSGGLHLYFPFPAAHPTWELAAVLETVLQNAGFTVALGQLELFPNSRLYSSEGPTLYKAHRLPMQTGSYLLNESWEPIYGDRTTFVQHWCLAQQRNALDRQSLALVLKQSKRQQYRLSGKADKFLNDLNAEIEPGWSGYGQTNYLLGRIAMRSYIFGHLLYASQPLEGKALVDDIVAIAKSLPGYRDWCRHQPEIEQRAEEWARCVENSRYFHFGLPKVSTPGSGSAVGTVPESQASPTWNQQQALQTREKIRQAIADLLDRAALPVGATARFQLLLTYGIGGGSLYRHRDLWHPAHLTDLPASEAPVSETIEVPQMEQLSDCAVGASDSSSSTSLFPSTGRNDVVQADPEPLTATVDRSQGGNSLHDGPAGPQLIQQVLEQIRQQRQQRSIQVAQSMSTIRQAQTEARQAAHRTRMQQYLSSGDPILMAEARTWMQANDQEEVRRGEVRREEVRRD